MFELEKTTLATLEYLLVRIARNRMVNREWFTRREWDMDMTIKVHATIQSNHNNNRDRNMGRIFKGLPYSWGDTGLYRAWYVGIVAWMHANYYGNAADG